jgi:hypothetical protein
MVNLFENIWDSLAASNLTNIFWYFCCYFWHRLQEAYKTWIINAFYIRLCRQCIEASHTVQCIIEKKEAISQIFHWNWTLDHRYCRCKTCLHLLNICYFCSLSYRNRCTIRYWWTQSSGPTRTSALYCESLHHT